MGRLLGVPPTTVTCDNIWHVSRVAFGGAVLCLTEMGASASAKGMQHKDVPVGNADRDGTCAGW